MHRQVTSTREPPSGIKLRSLATLYIIGKTVVHLTPFGRFPRRSRPDLPPRRPPSGPEELRESRGSRGTSLGTSLGQGSRGLSEAVLTADANGNLSRPVLGFRFGSR